MPSSHPFGYSPPLGTPGSFGPAGLDRAVDSSSLSRVAIAAILALVAQLLGIVILTFNNVSGLLSVSTSSSGSRISLPSPWVWVGYLLAAAALGLSELLLLRGAFYGLAEVDRRFSTPASLATVALVGIVLIFLGLGLFLEALYSAVACAGSGVSVPSSCLLTSGFWGGVALLGIGALLALVGYIGVLIGFWRLGARYGDSWFKVGAVLLIIPYINIIAALLILSAARRVRGQIETGTWAPSPR